MFSRLSVRAAAISPALKSSIQSKNVVVISSRCSSITKHIENWDKANEIFYGPERDTKNFPVFKQPETRPAVRLGFAPETWFKFFYDKTGVTGPYVLGAGVLTTVLSKEIWVVEHGFMEFISFWAAIYIIATKFGPKIGAYLNKEQDDFLKRNWEGPIGQVKDSTAADIEQFEKQIWREDGQKFLYEAKRENVDLQLEEEFRKRQAQVFQDVKRRLDYQLETENAKRRFQQNHMVNWIVNNVIKGITPQQERDSISKCIADLKGLAQKAQVAT